MNLIAILLVLAAAVFGVRGWLTSRSDSVARFRDRFAAAGIAFAAMMCWAVQAQRSHDWLWLAFDVVAACCWFESASVWWRKWDLLRQAERPVPPFTTGEQQ